MNHQKLLTTLGAIALLAGCSGGGSGVAPASVAQVAPVFAKTSGSSRLAIKIDARSVLAARRAPKQISAGVDTIDINVAGQDNVVSLSDTTACSLPTAGAQTCTIALAPGMNEAVSVSLLRGATSAGVSVSQTLTFTAGQTTAASFTITPIVSEVVANAQFVRLPEDGQQHTDLINVLAVDPLGNTISGPVDPAVFGSVSLATSSETLSNPTTFGPDPNGNFSATTTLTYAGDAPAGDQIVLTPSYVSQPGFAFAGAPVPQSVLLASIAFPAASINGPGSFSGSTITFSGLGTFSGLAITEKNAGAAATGSINTPGSTISSEAGSTPCNGSVTVTPGSTSTAGNNVTTNFSVTVAANATTCSVKFFTSDWGDASISQTLTIVPPAQAQLSVQ
jgi:hypothetical protein